MRTSQTYREVPILGRLERLLTTALAAAKDGAFSVSGLSGHNLYRRAKGYCKKVKGIAEDTYTKFLGHSKAVAREHYTSPTDAEFALVTKVA
ncbi:MAG: hypothetical protein ACYSUF_05160 [Planctomycetota bacterium]